MNASVCRPLARRKRRILRRLEHQPGVERPEPMMTAANIHYEIAERVRGLAPGGIGAIHLLARKIGLIQDLDRDLHLLKRHRPSHESDHVLTSADNLLAGGSRREHIEVRRNDEVYLDALGADRIPDPTPAGDFCRRFTEDDVEHLRATCNETRLRVWKQQPDDFVDDAFRDADGPIAGSDGWCKPGVDIASTGGWGYHPRVVSLAHTAEPLSLVNRRGHRPSHEPADVSRDKALALCRQGGCRRVTIRGDTKFTPTRLLDRGDRDGVRFRFGFDARDPLQELAERRPELPSSALERPPRSRITTVPRQARERPKERVVAQRQCEALKRIGAEVAEFQDRPMAGKKTYRVIVLRQRWVVEKGRLGLFEPDRYFFSLTHDLTTPASALVVLAHDRGDQENLIAPLTSGVKAWAMPVDDLVRTGAEMVMALLAWSLKAWAALRRPAHPRWAEKHRAQKRSLWRMEFSTFCVALIPVPCPVVRTSQRISSRLVSWTPWPGVFLRLVDRLHGRRLG